MDDANIYQRQELLEIYKNPSNKGVIEGATVVSMSVNPMCGDELTLYLKVQNDKITDAKFTGDACSVSIISASLLTDDLINKTVVQAKNITKKDVLDLIGVPLTTSRIRCATLVLEALEEAIKKYETKSKKGNTSV